jgi:HD superfamily phosphohydrolase
VSSIDDKMYKIIQDPLNGPVKVSGIFLDIINSIYFQRLRYIKQLGLCNLVFPGANHTRFEHSIGTMFLASEIKNYIGINDERLEIAALLHDIGHTPFSHSIEDKFFENFGLIHEDLTSDIITGKGIYGDSVIPEILNKYGYNPEEIADLATGRNKKTVLSKIISGSLDVDELDYLRRDSFYCGVNLGNIDYKRIFNTIKISENDIVGEEKSIPTIESAIIGRVLMYSSVYFHKTCRIAQKMLGIAYELYNGKDKNDLRMNDYEFIYALENDKKSSEIIKKIKSRNLYKIIYRSSYSEDALNNIREKMSVFDSDLYIIDVNPPLYFNEKSRLKTDFTVYYKDKKYEINKISYIVNALNENIKRRDIIVSADESILTKAASIIKT